MKKSEKLTCFSLELINHYLSTILPPSLGCYMNTGQKALGGIYCRRILIKHLGRVLILNKNETRLV